jgi:hypothetical protein
MTYSQFIEKYQDQKCVILLEGKRNVLPEDENKLIALAKKLAMDLPIATFRSGNAGGADEFFSQGVASVDINRLQLIKPYSTHRKNKLYEEITTSLDNITLHENVIYETKKASKNAGNLIDSYAKGVKNKLSIKGSYLLRDTVKVLGTDDIPPTDVALFYDDLKNPVSGGTGHTIRVCIENNIPHFNQEVWMGWVL